MRKLSGGKVTVPVYALIILILGSAFVQAQDKEGFKPEVKIGGTIFTGWGYNIGNSEFINLLDMSAPSDRQAFGFEPVKNQFETNKNSFYLDRAYINVFATLSPQLKARFTPDVYSFTTTTGTTTTTQWAYQVKFAWLEYTPLTTEDGLTLSFTGGVVPNLWVGQIDKYFGYRGAVKTLTDYTYTTAASVNPTSGVVTRTTASFFPTADLGMIAKLTLPKKYADVAVAVYNGNGFRNLSFDNRFKDVMFGAFIYPLAGSKVKKGGFTDLAIGGYGYIGKLGGGEGQTAKTRFGGMANAKYSFENSGFIKIGGEIDFLSNQVASATAPDTSVNGRGISTWLEFVPPIQELKEKVSLVFRYDWYDPNTNKPETYAAGFNADNGKQNLLMAGIFFKPVNIVTFGLNYQMLTYNKEFAVKYDGTATSSVSMLFFNTIVDF